MDGLLRAFVEMGVKFSALKLEVFVVAWGQTFQGIVVPASDYAETVWAGMNERIPPSPHAEVGVLLERSREAVRSAAEATMEGADADSLHLSTVRVNDPKTLSAIRIPFEAIDAYSLIAPLTPRAE